jgi:uncharacterized protein YndB with AHSA1/START domain
MSEPAPARLVVRRRIEASRERLFAAWTDAAELLAWWGPEGVRCTYADVDLRVGGRYRLDNLLPDGTTVCIQGEFLRVEEPSELVYTWSTQAGNDPELVTVRFEARGTSTEVVVLHERVVSDRRRREHELGWDGCLRRLQNLLQRADSGEGPFSRGR